MPLWRRPLWLLQAALAQEYRPATPLFRAGWQEHAASLTSRREPFCRQFGPSLSFLSARFGTPQVLCCRLGALRRPRWASGAGRPCRGELSGGCSTHHGWNDKPGHGLGGTSRGIHAAWHTTARCVQPLRQWKPGSPCSGERSSDVRPRRLRASPVASLYATFSFNLVRSSRLRIDYPVISCPAPVSPAGPWRTRIANTPPSRENKEGFRQGLRVSDHVSVLIGHFFCAAVVQSASSWGQARLGAVTDASCRTAAANLGGEYRIGFSKKPKSLQKDRAVGEGSDFGRGWHSQSPFWPCAHPSS